MGSKTGSQPLKHLKYYVHNDCANCGYCPGNSAAVQDVRNPLAARVGQIVVIKGREVSITKRDVRAPRRRL